MKIRLGQLRKLVRESIRSIKLKEVDLDPSNNPGRPADAYEYIGMHPSPTAAMSPPHAGGGGGEGGGASGDVGLDGGVGSGISPVGGDIGESEPTEEA
jgi:hypothetical protein